MRTEGCARGGDTRSGLWEPLSWASPRVGRGTPSACATSVARTPVFLVMSPSFRKLEPHREHGAAARPVGGADGSAILFDERLHYV